MVAACSGGEDDDGSVAFDEPMSYRITYDITDAEGDVTTEEVAVRRPFVAESVLSTDSFSRTALGRLALPEGVLAIAPAMGGVDLRLAPVLDDALERGLLEEGDEKTVAGRRCRVYRTGTSVTAGELTAPTERSYADVCFDDAGLLLEERWVNDGDLLRTKVATDVSIDEEGALGETWADEPTSLPGGGGAFIEVPDRLPVAPDPPAGFEHLGSFETELPAIAGARTTRSDVWTRGIDVLIVEIGPMPAGSEELEPLVVSLRGVEVRRTWPNGSLLRVVGTLSVEEVEAFAETIGETSG